MNALKLSATAVALIAGMSTAHAANITVSDGTVTTTGGSVNGGLADGSATSGQTGTATGITATISDINESELSDALQDKINAKVNEIDLSPALATKINGKADQSALDDKADQSALDAEKLRIDTNVSDIADNTKATVLNAGNIKTNVDDIKDNKDAITANLKSINQNTTNITSNTSQIGVNKENISKNTGRITANTSAIGQNTTNIATNAANISSNTDRIVSLENDVDELRSGVAMAVAIANAPVLQGGKHGFSVSGGFGHFKGKGASALKVAFLPTENMAVTASVATDFSNNVTAGAGLGFSF
ncbi:YadA-like family protein [Pseudovibrio sp. JE062]|uniref:YadA-like family protein n=1 Tax=Pseudovibrio sp. JE062 TaxID=439495 RepID=UPI000186BB8A|nr:YadA-like family protein [Pseudovibrio sp. JE062]EEA94882.1 conserved hypothetical protein [Pseudovibrio sp. JE062]